MDIYTNFSVDYNIIDISNIIDIQKYLIKKTWYKLLFEFIKKMFVGLLSVFTLGSFDESLVSNLKGPMKCVSLNNHPF